MNLRNNNLELFTETFYMDWGFLKSFILNDEINFERIDFEAFYEFFEECRKNLKTK